MMGKRDYCEVCGQFAALSSTGRCILCQGFPPLPDDTPLDVDGEQSFDDRSDVLLDPLDANGRWARGAFVNRLGRN